MTTKTQEEYDYTIEGVTSRIPAILAAKGWDSTKWRGYCQIAGLSWKTADKLFEGGTAVSVKTLRKVAGILDVDSVSDLIEFE